MELIGGGSVINRATPSSCRTLEGPALPRLSGSPPYVGPSVRPSVRPSPFGLIWSYTANIPWTPNIFTDSGPPIK